MCGEDNCGTTRYTFTRIAVLMQYQWKCLVVNPEDDQVVAPRSHTPSELEYAEDSSVLVRTRCQKAGLSTTKSLVIYC